MVAKRPRTARDARAAFAAAITIRCRDCALPLQLRRLERVAARHRAGLQSIGEPAGALRRRAMGEAVGDDVATALLLQTVIADGGRGLQRSFHVARLDEFPFRLRVIGPNAGKAVGLQLDHVAEALWLLCCI